MTDDRTPEQISDEAERIDTINVIRSIPAAIQGALYAAEAELKPRGGVA